MKSFFDNLFGKKQESPKIEKHPEPARHELLERKEVELYKKGDVIGGKYEVIKTLGKGGFGLVLLVYDRSQKIVHALKTFRDEFLADGAAREAFKKEAILWVNLERHAFVLNVLWVEEISGRLFLAMWYIEPDAQGRTTLADHLAQAKGPLETDQVLKWAIQFCLGMEHANAHGIKCHRDIKPANILIGSDETLRISDFGLAATAEAAWLSSRSPGVSLVSGSSEAGFGFSLIQADGKVRCGTPGYIAPEVYRCEVADTRSDIFSFGLVLWQMATGSRHSPFMVRWRGSMDVFLKDIYEQQMTTNLSRISGPIGTIIERCLRPKPSDRYRNFQELREDLDLIWIKRAGKKFEIPSTGNTFWVSKGASLSVLGRHMDAINCFDQALANDPGNADAWGEKGIALDCLGRYEEAIDCYDKALVIDPRYAALWINKGFPLAKLGRHEDAIGCYDKALDIDPQKASAWIGKGVGLKELGRHEEAIGCYDQALEIDSRKRTLGSTKELVSSNLVGMKRRSTVTTRRW